MTQVRFNGWLCDIQYKQYSNGRTALQLTDAADGSPVCTASKNLPDETLAEDEVCIKDYSENEGMLAALVEAGVISEPLRHIAVNHVTIPVCRLLKTEEIKK